MKTRQTADAASNGASWSEIEAVQCATCGVYTPTHDMTRSGDGALHCVSCGPPPPRARRAPRPLEDFDPIVLRPRWSQGTYGLRAAATAVLVIVSAFWLAACASQL